METIGKRVSALRTSRRLSQRKLAELCGVSQPTIANIERGRTIEIKGYVLEALAVALNTTVAYLLHGVVNENEHEVAMFAVELSTIFRRLDTGDQDTLLRMARTMLQSSGAGLPQPVPFLRLPAPTH
ncbi:helix-turn-helix domain-containing protein [Hydrogenophaga sp.]|uniref:helix-turn-helix domain-containing protein n=1 Tax=Hydrogenophaga sp. TaxID=1904254 RepID=UPI00271F1134|nr:helix-turn-helix domain-containing protein [Hydrogenophaga sp.]MDO9131996.1 helix-turn-helix domain-containing protein [Hydrogenophaga sp.]